MADEPTLIELDARGRASIGKLARHRRYLAVVEPDGKIILTPARIVPAEEVAHLDHLAAINELADLPDARPVKVAFCNWCPEPEKPSPDFHPDGQREHVEDVPVRRHGILRGAMTTCDIPVSYVHAPDPVGAPPGAAERARTEAEKLPTVGHWDDPSDNIGPTGRGVTAAPYGDDEPDDEISYRDRIQDADDDRERMARAFWQDYGSERTT